MTERIIDSSGQDEPRKHQTNFVVELLRYIDDCDRMQLMGIISSLEMVLDHARDREQLATKLDQRLHTAAQESNE